MIRALRSTLLGASIGAALALATPEAGADTTPAKIAQAADFFDAGAQAYKAGQYAVAAEAFLKANELSPSPALLFSAAQAFRKQYLIEPALDTLQRSIGLYRDYLLKDPQAKRREDAMQALSTLVPIETSAAAKSAAAGEKDRDAVKERRPSTRLLLSTTVDGAEVSVDGGPFLPAPLVAEVSPGPHQVRVHAPGYSDEQAVVQAVENELIPRPIALRPKPAKLRVTGTAGARVTIDGQVRATVPPLAPIEVAPGTHFVTATMLGREPYSKLLNAERDAVIDLVAELPLTRQRISALSVLSAGAAGVIAGGVLTGLTFARQGEAVALRDKRATTPLTPGERDRYNSAVSARDDLGRAAGITFGASALLLAVGAGLFLFDRPEVAPPSEERRSSPGETPHADFEVGLLSARARVTF